MKNLPVMREGGGGEGGREGGCLTKVLTFCGAVRFSRDSGGGV